jgi:hypothetical protein
MPVTETSWLDREPSLAELPRQAARLFQRGVRRPLALCVGLALLALLLVGGTFFAKRSYAPRIVLRAVEADADPSSMPELKRRLAEYVRQGIFTTDPLLELANRHGLYQKLTDPHARVEAFRRDIAVDVYQNYFVEQRIEGESPRSARVAVSYRAGDRKKAVDVTRELGALIIARVQATREEQSTRAAENAKDAAVSLEQVLVERHRAIAALKHRLEVSWDPEAQVELVSLVGSLPALERGAEKAERRAGALALGAAYEAHGVGLRFDVADDASLPVSDQRLSLQLVMVGVVFLCGLPLVVLAVGAGPLFRGAT